MGTTLSASPARVATRLRIHWTFFLLLAWIAISSASSGGNLAMISAVGFILLLFASVVAHEYGHVLAARHYGVQTREILLLPIGGIAKLDRIPDEPRAQFVIAVAGPLVTGFILLLLALALGGLPSPEPIGASPGARAMAGQLLWANLVLLVFNLLPAFPMDGGRILRSILAGFIDPQRATRIAARLGQALAIILGIFAILAGHILLMLIAIFVYFAAGSEAGLAALHASARHRAVGDVMVRNFETLSPTSTLGEAGKLFATTSQQEIPIVDENGRPVGFLSFDSLIAAIKRFGEGAPIGGAILPHAILTGEARPADEAIRMMESGTPYVAIVDEAGRMVGYQTLSNAQEEMRIRDASLRP